MRLLSSSAQLGSSTCTAVSLVTTTITVDGMALVACHEMGHHMGGAPKIDGWYGSSWATNEGGADYYGTLKCARRFFAGDDNASIVKTLDYRSFGDFEVPRAMVKN